jgi:hypothetical protein
MENTQRIKMVENNESVTVIATVRDGDLKSFIHVYDKTSKVVVSEEFIHDQDYIIGEIVDLKYSGNTLAALFMSKDGINTRQQNRYTGFVIEGTSPKFNFTKTEEWQQEGSTIALYKNDAIYMNTHAGNDYYLWNTKEDLSGNFRMTDAKSITAKPNLFIKGDEYNFIWVSVETEGKVLKMASTEEGFGIINVGASEVFTAIYIVVASTLITGIWSAVPYLLLISLLLFIISKLNKSVDNAKKVKNYSYLFVAVSGLYIVGLFIITFVSKIDTLYFLPNFFRTAGVVYIAFVLAIALGAFIAKLIIGQSKSTGIIAKLFTLAVSLFITYTFTFSCYLSLMSIYSNTIN